MRSCFAASVTLLLASLCGCTTLALRQHVRPKAATTLELRVAGGDLMNRTLEWRVLSGHELLAMGTSDLAVGVRDCPKPVLLGYFYVGPTTLDHSPLSDQGFTESVVGGAGLRYRANRNLGSCDVAVVGMHGPENEKFVVFLTAIDHHGSELSRELILNPPVIPTWAWPLFVPAALLDIATSPLQLIAAIMFNAPV